MNNELIVLEQLPIIKYQLEQLSVEIKEKVDRANSLVVNEETVKEVKQVRANLTKEFNELETQRKQVKNAIMQKYDEFEEIYKENVSNLYKQADVTLKEKIDNVEQQLKQEKYDELELFARQHIEVNLLDNIIDFDDIPINITLSASMKSLKEQILEFIKKVDSDVKLIELEEYKDEILDLYKNNEFTQFDFTKSKLEVINRHKRIEELKTRQLQKEEIDKLNKQVAEQVNEIVAPKEIIEDNDLISVSFKVTGTKEQIKKIKDLIIELGVEYE